MKFFSYQDSVLESPWGRFTKAELVRLALLGAALVMIITLYWTIRSLKDPIFVALVGIEYQPRAKILSLLIIFPLIMFYSKLVDLFSKTMLFYLFSGFYILFFVSTGFLLQTGTWGLGAGAATGPNNALGWMLYVAIESFGSMMVAIFWSFANSIYKTEEAKKAYPIILFMAQCGAVAGPTVVTYSAEIGIANIIFGSGILIATIPLFVRWYAVLHKHELEVKEKRDGKQHHAGLFEGVRIIATNPYVLGILGVSTIHESIHTVLDYQMKYVASSVYRTPEAFATFMGYYGQCVNVCALLWVITGSSYLLRKVGLPFCLMLYPLVVAGLVVLTYFFPTLWFFFGALVVFKMFNYALNNPTKEILYIPTDADTRYKSKAWIDAVGARSFKAIGSGMTNAFRASFKELSLYGSIGSLIMIAIWCGVSYFTGKRFTKLTAGTRSI